MTVSTMIIGAGGAPVDAVSAAIGEWCRRWPEKALARDFAVALQTAKKWRRGEDMPAGRHLVAMAERWGQPFLDHAFQAVLDDVTLDGRLEALEASFALLRRDLRHDEQDAAVRREVAGQGAGDRAPDLGGMARPRGQALATARALIFGVMLGATAIHLMPHMPDTVADLIADAGADMRPRPPKLKVKDGKRLAPKGLAHGHPLGRDVG